VINWKIIYGSGKSWKTQNFFLLLCGHPVIIIIIIIIMIFPPAVNYIF